MVKQLGNIKKGKDYLGKTMKCKYHKKCSHYKQENFTCNSFNAEDGYCGKYRELNEKQKSTKINLRITDGATS